MDQVWRQAVRAELASGEKRRYACILWDLTKMYERIGHHRLAAHALRLGFPKPLRRVASRAHRLPGHLSRNGMCALGAWPTRGVIAGCTVASTFAKVAVVEGWG